MPERPEGENQGHPDHYHEPTEHEQSPFTDEEEEEEEEGGPIKSFLEHLEDLRWMLIKVGVSLGLGMLICLVAAPQLVGFLTWPISGLLDDGTLWLTFLGPTEGFMVALRLAFYGGLVLSCPFILFFIAQFVVPALRRHEKKYFLGAFVIGGGLFVVGVFLCYFAFVNLSVRAFFQYNEWLNIKPSQSDVLVQREPLGTRGDSAPSNPDPGETSQTGSGSEGASVPNGGVDSENPAAGSAESGQGSGGSDAAAGNGNTDESASGERPETGGNGAREGPQARGGLANPAGVQTWRYQGYFLFVARFMLAMGISFELPVVILTLVKLGLVQHENLVKGRKYMLIFNLVLASIVTPQDLVTTGLMVLPLQFLFEICIWISAYWERRERRREAELGLNHA